MRVAELNLLAYGKFTDEKLSFHKAEHDFHVIIGPNEAGKSTVRRAITELLFGMEVRSPLGFKHALSDLRIAGVLESDTSAFSFIRSKQQKSLRSMSDEVLQESYLAPALGGLKQDTFEELHCLDHGRLLKGGQGIVDPKNTVSQILFQAASGVEDFTAIRDALGERAAALFAKGGRNNQFTKASEKLALAQRSLRDVQVRTKAWVDARDALQAAGDALEAERKGRRELDLKRTTWDRARRLAPVVEALKRLELEVQELGDVISFPVGAGEALSAGIEQMTAAAARLQTREEDLRRAQAELEAVKTDASVLPEAGAIARLGALCGLHPNHARDLPVRRAEVQAWLSEIFGRSAQFGWGTTEAEVRARIPQEKVIRAIDTLLKSQGAILAEERAADQALDQRQAALDELNDKLQAVADDALDPQLVAVLELAAPFRASEAKLKTMEGALRAAQTSARNTLTNLGRSELTEELLRPMRLPSVERVNTYRSNRQDLAQAADLSESLAQQSNTTASSLKLKLTQFERSHQVVTIAQVSDARKERDREWNVIKAGEVPLQEAAPRLDIAMRLADELGDSRTRSETDAAEVQALRDQIERAVADQQQHETVVEGRRRELDEFDARWVDMASAMGLPGIELEDLPDWLAKRDSALQAADVAALRQQEYNTERDSAVHARQDLAAAMAAAGVTVDETLSLAALCSMAQQHVEAAKLARTRRIDLQQHKQSAESALKLALKTLESKEALVLEWKGKWDEVLSRANLTGVGGDVAEVESAILAWDFIHKLLERVDTTRTERIETMEADLERMRDAAQALVQLLSPELAQNAPEQVFGHLKTRLEDAKRQADRKAQVQKYSDEAKRQRDDASSELTEVKRALEPLLKLAGVDEPLAAVPLVERWQAKGEKQAELAKTRRDLEADSDGLSLADIEAQAVSHPAALAAQEVLKLKDLLEDLETKLTALVASQLKAQQEFDTINGGDKAAVAEAQRHEALAEMSEVSEEYLQLATAGSLLKWAVDRYRDRKQGPLLQRASLVFKNLTRGSFQKLRVDYEQVPPALVAYRQNAQPVKMGGLSDGTRDQLFLALRIAALELQSEQGAPIPFIADDLFINFDDKRSQAGLDALYELSLKTQVIFLSHQEHLLPVIQTLFPQANVLVLKGEEALA